MGWGRGGGGAMGAIEGCPSLYELDERDMHHGFSNLFPTWGVADDSGAV